MIPRRPQTSSARLNDGQKAIRLFGSGQMFMLLVVFCSTLQGQARIEAQSNPETTSSEETNWRIARSKLDAEYFAKLEEIQKWALENNLNAEARTTADRIRPRDLTRQTIFIPPENGRAKPADNESAEWLGRLQEANRWQADRVFELGKNAAGKEVGAAAIQFFNEALYFNPDHAESRRILGHRKTEQGWSIYPDKIEIRTSIRENELTKWGKGYLIATTPNFYIESNTTKEQTRELAEKLERWHYVWRQVYFDYWCNIKNVQRWIDGNGSYSFGKRKFKVVFFQNREDYLKVLVPLVDGVSASTGYYNNSRDTSFFYFGTESNVQTTWIHELTHQLFRESIGSGSNLKTLENQYIWLDEGAATYAESLVDFGDYVTLGGFDSRRMQYARIRLFLEGYQIPMKEVAQLGRVGLQKRSDIVRIYSQIAAQFDMLMNDQSGEREEEVIEFLQLLFRGRTIKPGKFEELLETTYEQLDTRYKEFMVLESDQICRNLSAPLTRTELSFSNSQLGSECFKAIGKCHNLIWLDLSGNEIKVAELEKLASCKKLSQLILTRAPLEAGVLHCLVMFPELTEIDLSGSSVSDQQLLELQGQKNLKSIQLKSTRTTPAGRSKLKQLLPQLEIGE